MGQLRFYLSPMAGNFALVFLFLLGFAAKIASAVTNLTLHNNCPYTVWPGTLSGNGPTLNDGGFALQPDAFVELTVPMGWSGRLWARTYCSFDDNGNGQCATGDCGSGLRCAGKGGVPPATLMEFTFNGANGMDFYDISLVDGYNIGVEVRPWGNGTGDCRRVGCSADLNAICPIDLSVTTPFPDESPETVVVACKSPCTAFRTPEYCCTGDHGTPNTCSPTAYSELFKNACPDAYSYAYDDGSSLHTCTGSNYMITFCPDAPLY